MPSSPSAPTRTDEVARVRHSPQRGLFWKEGEYWTVGLGATVLRLKDAKGLAYIAYLLRHPETEFHALDLVGGIAGRDWDEQTSQSDLPSGRENLEKAGLHIADLGDAGELLDDQAKAAYRRRLSELRDELEEAKAFGKIEDAERVEAEIEALTKELSRAVGLGGRNRRAASASERARQSVSKCIKSVLEKVTDDASALGGILSRSIKTGSFCSYQPDPDFPVAWEFALTKTSSSIESSREPATTGESAPTRSGPLLPQQEALRSSPFLIAERTAFVGRDAEASAIRAVIDRAYTSQGSAVMLWDGSGVGKTRLAMEMAEYAASVGFRYAVGHCYERDEPFPYLPFVEIIESNLTQAASLNDYRRLLGNNAPELAQIAPRLRRIFPDLPRPPELPPAQQRRYLFQSISEALERAAREYPQLIILEGLQWADESSLALLIYLVNHLTNLPIVIIGTYRSGYAESNPALARTLEELIRLGIRPLKLGGLPKNAVGQMLQDLGGSQAPERLVSRIFEESQGYPFFVEELYRHLVAQRKVLDEAGRFRTDVEISEIDVPENVRLITSRRLERFEENEKRVLSAAAVIGRSFSFQLLTAITQTDVDDLFTIMEKAQQMGIIMPSSEGPGCPLTFAHELVRQTLLAAILPARRQQMHARIAEVIEQLEPAPATERAGEIADHLVKGESFVDRQKLIRWLIYAGSAALDGVAFDAARSSFESALSRVDGSDLLVQAELLYRIGLAERGLGRWENAHRHWDEAFSIFTQLDEREAIGRVSFVIAQAFTWTGRWREASEAAERGLARLPYAVADRGLLLAILGFSKAVAGDPQAAREAFKIALTLAEEPVDKDRKLSILAYSSEFNSLFLRLREALEDSDKGAALLAASNDPWSRTQMLSARQNSLFHLGRTREAVKAGEELAPLASKVGHLAALSYCRRQLAWAEFGSRPDLLKLQDKLEKDLHANMATGLDVFVAVSHAQLSVVEFFRGNWEKALGHADQSSRPQTDHIMRGLVIGTLFRQRAYAGDWDGALSLLRQYSERLARTGQLNTYGSWAMPLLVIEGLVVMAELDPIAGLYPVVCELIATGTVCLAFISRFPQTIAGLAAGALRQWDTAEGHFRIALQQAKSFPYQLEEAEISRFYAMMLLDRAGPGDHGKARTLLLQALASYRRIGMPRHVELTQVLFDRLQNE